MKQMLHAICSMLYDVNLSLFYYTNKSLIPIGDKLAISYIVECYPKEVIFVVTLGHFGDHVRQFLSIAYPNRQFEFVEVSPYVGARSSLAFSMLQAKKICSYHLFTMLVTL